MRLPKGWTPATLGDLAEYINGRGFKKTEWKSSGIPIIRIQNLNDEDASFNYADDSFEQRYRVKDGDLLVAWSASLGAYIWKRGDAWLNQHIFRVEPYDITDNQFLYYAIIQSINELYQKAHGMGMVHVTKGTFESHEVPLPPLNEQKRLAEKLDTILASVDAIKKRLDSTPAILRRFRQSVLNAGVKGELTQTDNNIDEFYKELTSWLTINGKKIKSEELSQEEIAEAKIHFDFAPKWNQWPLYALEQLVDQERGIPYGIVQTGEHFEDGIPTIRCGDVKWLMLNKENLKKVDVQISQSYSRTLLKGGEVLLAIRGTVGNAAVVDQNIAGANISREVAMIPVGKFLLPKFVAMVLQSPSGYACLSKKVRGVAQRGINLADVRRFATPIPSIKEQQEIVSRVESLFAVADTLEAKIDAARKRVDKLTQSILAKAFQGELVPQDPNDEPAEKLLEKIRKCR